MPRSLVGEKEREREENRLLSIHLSVVLKVSVRLLVFGLLVGENVEH